MATLTAFGDSITAGGGASDQSHRYIEKVAASKGWTLTNNGSSGARIHDPGITDAIYASSVAATDNFTLLCGTNNMHTDGVDMNYQTSFRENLLAVLAWLSLVDNKKQLAINNSGETGTWVTNSSSVYGGMGKRSTTQNSTMTFDTQGNTVYVGYIKNPNGVGSFTVKVDGTVRATVYAVGSENMRSDANGTYGASLVRIPNLPDSPHTVQITVTSPTNPVNTVYIDWVGGNGFMDDTAPNVWCGNVILGTAASYVAAGGSDTAVGQFNSIIGEAVSQLASDGLRVVLVDCVNAVDVNTEMDTDGIHPNDAGHDKLSKAFLANMAEDAHLQAVANERHTQWRLVNLLNTWVSYGGGFSPAEFMKDSTGMVHVHGLVKSGTIGSTPMFYLPQGWRPAATISFPVRSNNAFGYVEVYPDGRVNPQSGNNSHFCLDTIQFMAEQ